MSDITAEIKRYDSVTEEAKADFEALMKESEGYEPYFDTGHPMYMAYIDGEPVGILTYLVTSENETEPDGVDHTDGSEAEGKKEADGSGPLEAEFTIFVKPAYRGKTIAKQLIKQAKEDISKEIENCRTVVTLPEALLRSSLAAAPAYAELLLRLGKERFQAFMKSPQVQDVVDKAGVETEVKQSDDSKVYTLSSDGKEIASLKLDFEPNATNLYRLFVEPALRNKGFGTTLVTRVLNDVFSKKDSPVILNVKSTNDAAVNLYENVGFDEIDRVWYFEL